MASAESAKERFKIKGQSLQSNRHSAYTDGSCNPGDDRSESASTGYGSKGTASGGVSSCEESEVHSESSEMSADDMKSHVIEINKNLVQQLDALRLRLEVDFKHSQEQRSIVLKETETKLTERKKELTSLKRDVEGKSEKLTKLTDDNERKSKEIDELQRQIEDLMRDVGDTKIYADQLESEMLELQKDKGKLQTGSAYQEKEEEIKGLHREIEFLRKNLSRFEKELTKAKEVIAQQGSKVRAMENENKNTLVKFREALNKISLNMRFEIGKMRDVMRSQWREMKDLREQNETMSKDIREIRDLLVEQNKTKQNRQQQQQPKTTTSAKLPTKNSEHMINMAFKPAFPVRSRDRSNLQTKTNRF